ncbi:MAG: hypothetical protein AAB305_03340 [Candidatus Zixiibacteriota bacterium]
MMGRRFISLFASMWLFFSTVVLFPTHVSDHSFLSHTSKSAVLEQFLAGASGHSHSEDCQVCRLNGQLLFIINGNTPNCLDLYSETVKVFDSVAFTSDCDLSVSLRAPPSSYSL